MWLKYSVTFFLSLAVSVTAFGQIEPSANSPYSRFGVGNILPQNDLRSRSMSHTGMAIPHPDYISVENPALLSRAKEQRYVVKKGETLHAIARAFFITEEELIQANKGLDVDEIEEGDVLIIPLKKYTRWDASIGASYFNVLDNDISQSSGTGFFNYFLYSFPISHKNTVSVGINRFSSVNFRSTVEDTIAGTGEPVQYFDQGNGGLYQFYLADGYDISRNLSAGLQLSYIFGNLERESFTQFEDEVFRTGSVLSTSYSGLQVKPALFYQMDISKRDTNGVLLSARKLNFSIGADFYPVMYQDLDRSLQEQNILGNIVSDTLIADEDQNIVFPPTFRAGLGLESPEKYSLGLDLEYTAWSAYTGYRGVEFTNTFSVSAGGEYWLQPNQKRRRPWPLRAGVRFSKMLYILNNSEIYERAFSIGTSIPVSKAYDGKVYKNIPFNKLNISIEAGQRGTTENGFLKEQFIRAFLGIIINDVWFETRKID